MENNLLQEAIATLKAGQRSRARILLVQLLRQDTRNEAAWLWLSGAVDSDSDRLFCLNQALAINPDNARARQGVEMLSQKGVTAPSPELDQTAETGEAAESSGFAVNDKAAEQPAQAAVASGPTPPEGEDERAPQAQPAFVPPAIPEGFVLPPEPEPERVIPIPALLVIAIILIIVITAVAVLISQRGL